VESALAQSHDQIEVVVVNDASTDNTSEIAQSLNVSYIELDTNVGLASARNQGLAASSGDCVVFLDADDRLLQNGVQHGVEALQRSTHLAWVHGLFQPIDVHGAVMPIPLHAYGPHHDYRQILAGNGLAMHATAIFRRKALESVGAYRHGTRLFEDYDLYLRLARNHTGGYHEHLVAEYRYHSDTLSSNPVAMLKTIQTRWLEEKAVISQTELPYWKLGWERGNQIFARRLVWKSIDDLKHHQYGDAANSFFTVLHRAPLTLASIVITLLLNRCRSLFVVSK